ncbi:glutathione S-transferase [Microdochium bolleyi]|uniref:glutathione transferase n=1 Tax=Microdochium bolleyi TaxID=196109 RepID=A0A136IR55_9PEZI|nr:glutathione S-transferase [Microdochium bolleyi]
MFETMQPVKIWLSAPGPNGWKPLIYLEELGVPYEVVNLPFSELIGDEFRKVNPNGKIPVMEDPNTGIRIWESGAIILYIIEQFGQPQLKEFHLARQWLVYQVAQQGPYYGQLGWFSWLHPEQLPSAVERYQKQALRIMKVLDDALAEIDPSSEGDHWLVGGKCTYADLSYVMYHVVIDVQAKTAEGSMLKQFPHLEAWHAKMLERPSVAKVVQMRLDAMAREGFTVDEESLRAKADEMLAKEAERA